MSFCDHHYHYHHLLVLSNTFVPNLSSLRFGCASITQNDMPPVWHKTTKGVKGRYQTSTYQLCPQIFFSCWQLENRNYLLLRHQKKKRKGRGCRFLLFIGIYMHALKSQGFLTHSELFFIRNNTDFAAISTFVWEHAHFFDKIQ